MKQEYDTSDFLHTLIWFLISDLLLEFLSLYNIFFSAFINTLRRSQNADPQFLGHIDVTQRKIALNLVIFVAYALFCFWNMPYIS